MAHRAGNPHTSRHAERLVAAAQSHTSDLAVIDPQHIHEEMDHANATFHQLTRDVPIRPSPDRPRGRVSTPTT
jgi:hypothetical protein